MICDNIMKKLNYRLMQHAQAQEKLWRENEKARQHIEDILRAQELFQHKNEKLQYF